MTLSREERLLVARERWKKMTPERRTLRREYERIYQEARRRAEGIDRRNLRRYEEAKAASGEYLDIAPVQEFLKEINSKMSINKMSTIAGMDTSQLERFMHGTDSYGKPARITLANADRIFTRFGFPELLSICYD